MMKNKHFFGSEVALLYKDTGEIVDLEPEQVVQIKNAEKRSELVFEANDYKGVNFCTLSTSVFFNVADFHNLTMNQRGFFISLTEYLIATYSIVADEAGKPMNNKAIAEKFGLNESTSSHYIKQLESVNLLRKHKDIRLESSGNQVIYMNPNVVKNSSKICSFVKKLFEGKVLKNIKGS
jgi:predicted transcriptional regulator